MKNHSKRQEPTPKQRMVYYKDLIIFAFKSYVWVLVVAIVAICYLHYYFNLVYVGKYSKLYEITGVCSSVDTENSSTKSSKRNYIVLIVDGEKYTMSDEISYTIRHGSYNEFVSSCVGAELTIQYTSNNPENDEPRRFIAALSTSDNKEVFITLQETADTNRGTVIFLFCFAGLILLFAIIYGYLKFSSEKPKCPWRIEEEVAPSVDASENKRKDYFL